ncbi:hypothetical protein KCP75_04110 [Salmonella enterica subsp. enterica]|nr:hypothetical protein KCP75_04110 [Salmonella enterica subsp. enterica]
MLATRAVVRRKLRRRRRVRHGAQNTADDLERARALKCVNDDPVWRSFRRSARTARYGSAKMNTAARSSRRLRTVTIFPIFLPLI